MKNFRFTHHLVSFRGFSISFGRKELWDDVVEVW